MLVGDTGEVVGVDRAAAAWASRWKGRVPVFAHEFTHCLLMHQQTAAFDEHWRAAVEWDERRRREEANRASGALEPSEVLIGAIVAAPRRPPATRRRSSARTGREWRIARRVARRQSVSPTSRARDQARPGGRA